MRTRRTHKNWLIVSALVIDIGGPMSALGALPGASALLPCGWWMSRRDRPMVLRTTTATPLGSSLRWQADFFSAPFLSVEKRQDLLTLADLLTTGQVTPVIDRTYPLDEAADALRYVAAGHTRGKVVITI